MRPILCLGSINADRVYRVPRIARDGETLAATHYEQFAGGKGANQSVALARAGARVAHAGRVGGDGRWLIDRLAQAGVDVSRIAVDAQAPTGHAVIQVDDAGRNAIVIEGGANRCIGPAELEAALAGAERGDTLLLQNEISGLADAVAAGADQGMRVVLNPAPMTGDVTPAVLERVSLLVVNESEAEALVGGPAEAVLAPGAVPCGEVLLTLGERGSVHRDSAGRVTRTPAARAAAVADTTAAGDTYIGYFLAGRALGLAVPEAMGWASRAAAWCVARPGAMASIPTAAQLDGAGRSTR